MKLSNNLKGYDGFIIILFTIKVFRKYEICLKFPDRNKNDIIRDQNIYLQNEIRYFESLKFDEWMFNMYYTKIYLQVNVYTKYIHSISKIYFNFKNTLL